MSTCGLTVAEDLPVGVGVGTIYGSASVGAGRSPALPSFRHSYGRNDRLRNWYVPGRALSVGTSKATKQSGVRCRRELAACDCALHLCEDLLCRFHRLFVGVELHEIDDFV